MVRVVLPESLTIESVSAIRHLMLDAMSESPPGLVLDGLAVEDVDGAGIQLLLAAAKEAVQRELPLVLEASPALQSTIDLLAIGNRFTSAQSIIEESAE